MKNNKTISKILKDEKVYHSLLCHKCREVLPVKHFSKHSSRKRGYQTWCKTCSKIYLTEYRGELKHPDYVFYGREKEYKKERYKITYQLFIKNATPEQKAKIKEKKRDWANNNRDKTREYQKLYHQKYRLKKRLEKLRIQNELIFTQKG